jgi:hypothetical protein
VDAGSVETSSEPVELIVTLKSVSLPRQVGLEAATQSRHPTKRFSYLAEKFSQSPPLLRRCVRKRIASGLRGNVTGRITIHAGFAKCGSTSIQAALIHNFARLQKDGVSLFGKELRIAHTSADLGVPLWFLEAAREKGEPLAQRLSDEIESVRGADEGRLGILSAENLARPEMAPLLAGLDQRLDVSLVFYLRPQLEWIPSAWKQWGLKRAMSLSDFVSRCIRIRRPPFKLGIETWRNALPAAKIHVRFLIPELLIGGNPARDFFELLGLSQDRYPIGEEARNPSLDFSILHVLSKNPHLFPGVHDNKLMKGLMRALPAKFQATNIRMLSPADEARIEESFREENRWLLNTYCSGIDVDRIYRTYFRPREAEARYSSMTDLDLIYRCLGIILESIAASSDQATAVDGRSSKASKQES